MCRSLATSASNGRLSLCTSSTADMSNPPVWQHYMGPRIAGCGDTECGLAEASTSHAPRSAPRRRSPMDILSHRCFAEKGTEARGGPSDLLRARAGKPMAWAPSGASETLPLILVAEPLRRSANSLAGAPRPGSDAKLPCWRFERECEVLMAHQGG